MKPLPVNPSCFKTPSSALASRSGDTLQRPRIIRDATMGSPRYSNHQQKIVLCGGNEVQSSGRIRTLEQSVSCFNSGSGDTVTCFPRFLESFEDDTLNAVYIDTTESSHPDVAN